MASPDQLLGLWLAPCCCAALQSRSYLLLNEKGLNGKLTAKKPCNKQRTRKQLKSNTLLHWIERQQDPGLQNGHSVMKTYYRSV